VDFLRLYLVKGLPLAPLKNTKVPPPAAPEGAPPAKHARVEVPESPQSPPPTPAPAVDPEAETDDEEQDTAGDESQAIDVESVSESVEGGGGTQVAPSDP
jgi:hypothetical protein